MMRLYYRLWSYIVLAYDCLTVGPRKAYEPFRAAKSIKKVLRKNGQSNGTRIVQ